MERFLRPYTRSQSKPVNEPIEIFRDDNKDDSSDTGPISPDTVPPPCLDTNDTLLNLVDSPDNNNVHSSEASDLLSQEWLTLLSDNSADQNVSSTIYSAVSTMEYHL